MCLFVTLLFLGPRAALFIYWIGWPARWDATFDTFLLPLLGVVFLPWTTFMYVLVAPGGVNGFDYVWIGLSAMLDVMSYAGDGVYGRRRMQPA